MGKSKFGIGAIVRIKLSGSPLDGREAVVRKVVCNGRGVMLKFEDGHDAYCQTKNLILTGKVWGGPWEKWGE
ncbi:MAG: hypothetical protein LBB60_10925 [Desulfovibrio sp.]|jgi:hypothetical protein|nr:hypothetical protein [Desulfovibrio sp.]